MLHRLPTARDAFQLVSSLPDRTPQGMADMTGAITGIDESVVREMGGAVHGAFAKGIGRALHGAGDVGSKVGGVVGGAVSSGATSAVGGAVSSVSIGVASTARLLPPLKAPSTAPPKVVRMAQGAVGLGAKMGAKKSHDRGSKR